MNPDWNKLELENSLYLINHAAISLYVSVETDRLDCDTGSSSRSFSHLDEYILSHVYIYVYVHCTHTMHTECKCIYARNSYKYVLRDTAIRVCVHACNTRSCGSYNVRIITIDST